MAMRERHGFRRYEHSDSDDSDSEESDEEAVEQHGKQGARSDDDDDDKDDEKTERRMAKRWAKRVKMRRVLSEVEDSRSSRGRYLDEDEESQSIMTVLKRAHSANNPLKRKETMKRSEQPALRSEQGDENSRSALFGEIPNGALARKGSFITMRRATSAPGGSKTVSNNRFIFQGVQGASGGTLVDDTQSQSNSSSVWSDHMKRATSKSSVDPAATSMPTRAPQGPSLSSSLWASLGANRFKKAKKN